MPARPVKAGAMCSGAAAVGGSGGTTAVTRVMPCHEQWRGSM
jgi:hypothetical protein